jgi:hypothetical protein
MRTIAEVRHYGVLPTVRGCRAARETIGHCSIHATLCAKLQVMTTIEELMKSAVDARRVAQNAIALAVREARAADWSWDRISAALGGTPNGETLRRNFGGEKETAP